MYMAWHYYARKQHLLCSLVPIDFFQRFVVICATLDTVGIRLRCSRISFPSHISLCNPVDPIPQFVLADKTAYLVAFATWPFGIVHRLIRSNQEFLHRSLAGPSICADIQPCLRLFFFFYLSLDSPCTHSEQPTQIPSDLLHCQSYAAVIIGLQTGLWDVSPLTSFSKYSPDPTSPKRFSRQQQQQQQRILFSRNKRRWHCSTQ